jgi:hypothetical protein
MRCSDTHTKLTRRKPQHGIQSHVHECRGRSDFLEMELIDETRRVMIMSPGANSFLDASAHYHPMNTGDFTQRLGVLYSPCRRCAQRVMLPRTLTATMPCRSAAACRHLAATGTVPTFLRTVNHEKPADLFVVSLDACDGAEIDCVAAAFEIAIASPFTEARERPLLRRLARDPPFSTERRTYKRRDE